MKPILQCFLTAVWSLSAVCAVSHAQTSDSTSREKPKVVRMPSFQGGDINAFARWMSERIKYPESMVNKDIGGRVVVKFIIEKDGSLTFWEIMESPDTVFSREVVLLALQAPRWEPAILENGQPGRCYIVVPVNFKLDRSSRGNRPSRQFDTGIRRPGSYRR